MVNPFMDSVVLTTANQPYNLLTLVRIIDPSVAATVMAVQIQVDPGAGGAHVYIGNHALGIIRWGVNLFATQAFTTGFQGGKVINLNSIFLMSDANSIRCGVVIVDL